MASQVKNLANPAPAHYDKKDLINWNFESTRDTEFKLMVIRNILLQLDLNNDDNGGCFSFIFGLMGSVLTLTLGKFQSYFF